MVAGKLLGRCLGHFLSASASIAVDWNETVKKIWGAYWANSHAGLLRASRQAQDRFMKGSLKPVAAFRWSRWPWQRTYGKRLDKIQRALIGCMRPVCPQPGEEISIYHRRRHLLHSRAAEQQGRWSKLWAKNVINWENHVTRAHDSGIWSLPLHDWHGEQWLNFREHEMHKPI